MRIYTAHLRPGSPPRLVREGFSLGAFLFGPLWLFAQRAWIAGLLSGVVFIALFGFIGAMAGSAIPFILLLGYAVLLGWNGRDLCRWSLARQGYEEQYVLAARTSDGAYGRLVARDAGAIGPGLP